MLTGSSVSSRFTGGAPSIRTRSVYDRGNLHEANVEDAEDGLGSRMVPFAGFVRVVDFVRLALTTGAMVHNT